MAKGRLDKRDREELSTARQLVEDIRDRIQSDFDDATERWQESDAGAEAQTIIDTLSEAADQIAECEEL